MTGKGWAPLQLNRLSVNKFRAVAPGTELTFGPGVTLVLGQNGSGKTTLLMLASCALRVDFSSLADEEYDLGFETEAEGMVLSGHVKNVAQPAEEAPADANLLRLTGSPPKLFVQSFELLLRMSHSGSTLSVHGGSGKPSVALLDREDPKDIPTSTYFPVILWNAWRAHADALAQRTEEFPYLFLFARQWRYDEALGAFDAMIGRPRHSAHAGPPETTLGIVLSPGESAGRLRLSAHGDFLPTDLTSALQDLAVESASQLETLRVGCDQLPFLRQAVELLGFRNAEWKAEASESSQTDDTTQLTYGAFGMRFYYSDKSYVSHSQLSFGQKRLVSFLYFMDACFFGTLLADELVNGLHYRWIDSCMATILARNQALLTSQNPLLLDHMEFDSPEAVRQSFVICASERGERGYSMSWTRMGQDEALGFFGDYTAKTQHVAEILRQRGLW